jgi:RNA polymerase sigma-70 factor (ECF subfamily)
VASLPAAKLDEWVKGAQAAWPGVRVERAAFLEHLTQHLSADGAPKELNGARGAELYLALACAQGQPRAIQHLESAFFASASKAVRRIDPSPAFVDEVMQRLRQRLLMATAKGPPRIAGYQGRGPLSNWLRASALAIAFDLHGEHKGHTPLDEETPSGPRLNTSDLELAFIQERHQADFKAAFKRALEHLDSDERNVIRLHLADGLTLVEVGTLLGIHRATVTRWYSRARQRLLDELRRGLGERLKMSRAEVDSLTRAMRSQLDLSISALLKVQG